MKLETTYKIILALILLVILNLALNLKFIVFCGSIALLYYVFRKKIKN
jgi:hypothetical protein